MKMSLLTGVVMCFSGVGTLRLARVSFFCSFHHVVGLWLSDEEHFQTPLKPCLQFQGYACELKVH
jgi:hypothetical protein